MSTSTAGFFSDLALSIAPSSNDGPAIGPYSVGIAVGGMKDPAGIIVLEGDRENCRRLYSDVFTGGIVELANLASDVVSRFPGSWVTCDDRMFSEVLQSKCSGTRVTMLEVTRNTKLDVMASLNHMLEAKAIDICPDERLLLQITKYSIDKRNEQDELVVALALAARGLSNVYKPPIKF